MSLPYLKTTSGVRRSSPFLLFLQPLDTLRTTPSPSKISYRYPTCSTISSAVACTTTSCVPTISHPTISHVSDNTSTFDDALYDNALSRLFSFRPTTSRNIYVALATSSSTSSSIKILQGEFVAPGIGPVFPPPLPCPLWPRFS